MDLAFSMNSSLTSRYVAGLSAIAHTVVAAVFLPHETIWIDETTQLNGIALGPVRVVNWLMGDGSFANGVPMDRMPPLSFWTAQLWSTIFGGGEHSLRVLGLLCASLATFVLALAAGRISGWKGAAFVGAVFALSPFNATLGLSIRAYPIFMLLASVAWYAAMQIVTELPTFRIASLSLFAMACILACFTHFYATVMTACLLIALLMVALLRRIRPWPLVVTGGLIAIPLLGLTQFILSSSQMSHVAGSAKAVAIARIAHGIGRLVVRMVVSPTVATLPAMATIMALAAVAITGLAALRGEKRSLAIFALVGVFLGIAVSSVAAVIGVGFDTLAPHYNLWLPHGVLLAGAAAFGVPTARNARFAMLAALILIFSNLVGDVRLLAHPEHFNHGPQNDIESIVREVDEKSLAVVHDPVNWAWSYFPLRCVHGPALPQYRTSPDGRTLTRIGSNASEPSVPTLPQRYVLVVSTRSLTTEEIARDLAGSPTTWEENPFATLLRRDPNWQFVRSIHHVSQVAGDAALFERVGAGPARRATGG
jgi:hypothetical protein